MKALLFDGVSTVNVGDAPKPDLQTSKDALIRVTHSSICGSDLHILNGRISVEKGVIMGHEGVGVVEKVGSDVKRVKPGDRVVVSVSVQCGECENCRKGLVAFCERGGIFGHGVGWGDFPGTQAEFMRVPYADAVLEPIPPSLSEEQAIFVGDILSTGYMACENGSIRPGDVVAVFGAGPVG
ncbi:MAG TPA: alcohol dehydrogenase catalytic domain-containing protein, partial [Thermodesulfobacteriota bacterium]|nr:alcohol dehydrogenase catalytic domain-containing protein [Thermodesulfobacteriota bacterium]